METRRRRGGAVVAGSQRRRSDQELRGPRHREANGLLRETRGPQVTPAADALVAVVRIKGRAGSVVFAFLSWTPRN